MLATAFLVRIGATLCLGDNMAENQVLHHGVCGVVVDAARDFIENIHKKDTPTSTTTPPTTTTPTPTPKTGNDYLFI